MLRKMLLGLHWWLMLSSIISTVQCIILAPHGTCTRYFASGIIEAVEDACEKMDTLYASVPEYPGATFCYVDFCEIPGDMSDLASGDTWGITSHAYAATLPDKDKVTVPTRF